MNTRKRAKVSRRSAGGARQIEAEVAALERALSEKKEILDAVRLVESSGLRVLPKVAAPRAKILKGAKSRAVRKARSAKTADSRLTWSDEMRHVLQEQEAGISYGDLLAILAKGPLGKKPRSKGDKGFYQAIKRLTDAGDIVKGGGLLYSAKLAQTLKSRGKPLPVHVSGRGGSSSIVLGILNEHPQGLSGPEIKELAGKNPNAPRSMREHDQYIYTVLGGLKQAGAILRMEDGKYRLSASHAGSIGTH